MNEIAKKLKEAYDRSDLTYAELAKVTNIPKSALQRYVTGDTGKIPLDRLRTICDALQIDTRTVLGWEETGPDPDPVRGIIQMQSMNVHQIPLIGSAAAGEPVCNEEVSVYIDGPLKADCAIRVEGTSMEPTFLDGDLLYIRSQPTVDFDGQIAVVICGDEACVKHVYRQEDGLMLMSDNPRFAPMLKRFSDYDGNIRILGKVIGFTRFYKQ